MALKGLHNIFYGQNCIDKFQTQSFFYYLDISRFDPLKSDDFAKNDNSTKYDDFLC